MRFDGPGERYLKLRMGLEVLMGVGLVVFFVYLAFRIRPAWSVGLGMVAVAAAVGRWLWHRRQRRRFEALAEGARGEGAPSSSGDPGPGV